MAPSKSLSHYEESLIIKASRNGLPRQEANGFNADLIESRMDRGLIKLEDMPRAANTILELRA